MKKPLHSFLRNKILLSLIVAGNLHAMAEQPIQYVMRGAATKYNFYSFTPPQVYENIEKLNSVNSPLGISNSDFGKIAPRENPLWYEQYDKRTATGRTFIKENGETALIYAYTPINYKDKNGNFLAIDGRLSPSTEGWSAPHQQFPTYLHADGSTELTLSENDRLKFNFNSSIGGSSVSLKNYTVGDAGMIIHDAIAGVDKRIIFKQNRIETDYLLNKPLAVLSQDLVISEEIILPQGYSIKEKKSDEVTGMLQSTNSPTTPAEINRFNRINNSSIPGEMIVVNADGVECAHFKIPFCYDSNKDKSKAQQSFCYGKYQLRTEGAKTFLDVIVPSAWVNNKARVYPITIDPIANGPVADWVAQGGGDVGSCLIPTYATLPLTVTIPADFTVTQFTVQTCYYATGLFGTDKSDGRVYFTTDCGRYPTSGTLSSVSDGFGGYADLPPTRMDALANCFAPSCSQQTFILTYNLGEDINFGGCDDGNFIYYDSFGAPYPYEAVVSGEYAQISGSSSSWSVSPATSCSNVCSLTLTVPLEGGNPPYTVHHAWDSNGGIGGTGWTGGTYTAGVGASGTASITLTVPAGSCVGSTCAAAPLSVPAPTVTDGCGNPVTVSGTKSVTRTPLPVVTAAPTTNSICSGAAAGITLTSCVSGSVISWNGSNGHSGTGNISEVLTNVTAVPVIVTYTVTVATSVASGGCTGNTITVPVTVNPLPTVGAIASPSTSVCSGTPVTLNGTGASSYTWSSGVTNNVAFVPGGTNTYTVTGTSSGCSNTGTITVTITGGPTVGTNASPATTVCSGTPVTLNGTGATSYAWTGGVTNNVAFVPPLGANTYTVTGTTSGCSGTSTVTINVTSGPTVGAGALPSTTICAGSNVTLSGTGATSYSWSGGVTNGLAFAPPLGANTYTVTGTTSGCSGTSTITVNVSALPTVSASALPSTTICAGSNVTLSGTGAGTYTWSGGVTNGLAFAPPVGSNTYTVTGTSSGCSNTGTITVNVTALPVVGVSVSPATTICAGSNVTLSGTGAVSYSWTGGVTNALAFAPPVGANTYSVTGTTSGCSNTSSITINVTALPSVGVSASPATTICTGSQVTLSGTGAISYSWSSGVTNGLAFAPAGTNTYTVTGTTSGCSNTATVIITVTPLPTVGGTASPANAVCAGTPVTLSGTGATTYAWSGGITNGLSFVPPVGSNTYTVTGTLAGCGSNTGTVTINVTALPTVGASASPSNTICAGSPVTLTGTGAVSYSWNGGITNGLAFVPGGSATYTVTGTSSGCSNTGTVTVNVTALPVVGALASPSNAVCAGSNVTLSGTGAISYSWSGGVTNALAFAPPVGSNTYTVTGTTSGCSNTSTITINVTALPVVGSSASPSTTLCAGSNVTLSGTGAASYAWSGGVTNAVAFAPPVGANTYTVTGTTGGCSNTGTITINVTALPVVGGSASPSTTICSGSTVTLSGTGALSYSWSGGVTNGASFIPPAGSNTYTVTGTTSGCSNTGTITINVTPLPTVGGTASPANTVCSGTPVTLSGTGATTYSWSGGVNNAVSFVPPVGTNTYTVTGTLTGCGSNTGTVTITVNPLPTVGGTASPANTVCAGTSVTLSGTGAATYTWTGGVTNGSSFIPAAGTNTYTVTGTSSGCSGTSTVVINVNPLPTVGGIASPANTVCAGTLVTLSGTGATTYIWTDGVTNGASFTPAIGTNTYTVTGTLAGCGSNTGTVVITVNALPTVGQTALPSNTVCAGTPVTLSGTGASTYSWTGGVTNSAAFTPSVGTNSYTVTGTASGCSNTSTVSVTVNPLPTVGGTASPANTVCAGTSVTLSGTGATTYTWTGGVTNGSSFIPAAGTNTYTVTGTSSGCSGTSTVVINVNPLPTVGGTASPANTVCAGTPVTLSGTGATTYIWTGGVTNGAAFTPAVGTNTYTVTGTLAGCGSNTGTVVITVNALPTVGGTASPSNTVCIGTPVTLSGTGASTYSWTGGVTNGTAFTPSIGTNSYTVTGTASGCSNTGIVSVTVNPLPTVGGTASPANTVCAGTSVTLSGTGATTYTWTGSVTNGASFIPAAGTNTYTVTGTSSGCSGTSTVVINVTPLPNVGGTASPANTVCAGTPVTLSGTGATTYSWSGGVTNGASFTPAVGTNTYTVTGTLAGCGSNTGTVVITVNALPTVGGTASPFNTVCAGTSVTLSGTGASTYSWTGGVTNGTSFIPVVGTKSYTVTGTASGCSNTGIVSVTVNALPTVGGTASPANTVCAGTSVTLSGTGATTYSWSGGVTNGSSFIPSAGTNTYTVTGTSSGCSGTSTVVINVNPLPNVGGTASPANTVCAGTPVTLSGTGATTYSWTGGVTNGAAFTPAVGTNTYTVTGTLAGCGSNSGTVTVTVNALPTVGGTVSPANTVCAGTSVTLSGTGASTYSWTGGVNNGASFIPVVGTKTYTVTGTASGCSNKSTVTLTVNGLPSVDYIANPGSSVCPGTTVTLNGTGATTYTWTGGISDGTPFTANATNTYTVTGTANGCSNSSAVTITVAPLNATVNHHDTTVCSGHAVYLLAGGGSTYAWHPAKFFASDSVSANATIIPSASTTYSVTVTSGNCSSTKTVTLNVFPPLTPPVVTQMHPQDSILTCTRNSLYTHYQWYFGTTAITNATDTFVIIHAGGNYSVIVQDENGCTISSGINVTVTTGLPNFSSYNFISVFPNPASEELTIIASKIHKSEAIRLTIVDMLGKMVRAENIYWRDEQKVNVSNLAAGIYYLQLEQPEGIWIGRFVKE